MKKGFYNSLLSSHESYNNGVRDAMKELWLYDGLIPDEQTRKNICEAVMKKLSYKSPKQKPLKYQTP